MKTKLIASLAVAASLLLSGCVTRYVQVPAPVAAPAPVSKTTSTDIKTVGVCSFMMKMKGKQYGGLTASLVTFQDGVEFVKFPNGEVLPVYNKLYTNDGKHLMHFVKDSARDGSLIVGAAYDCK